MANTNTETPNALLDTALAGIPKKFRTKLITSYLEVKRSCAESRFESAGLSAGKFCEACIRFLQERALGTSTAFGTKIANFADECRRIIQSPNPACTDAEKHIIPRALVFLYTMRNKRGIGHVGGDVDANAIDLAVMARGVDWIVCELIRIHHGLSLEEAQDLVDALAVRRLPDIWEVAGKRRVLRDGLPAKDETLLLLYSSKDSSVLLEDLVSWVEYSNSGVYKSKVLFPLHKCRFIEWDRESDSITLSPKGAKEVEDRLLKSES